MTAAIVDLRARLTRSVAHAEAVDLGSAMESAGSDIHQYGGNIRQLALLDDEPSVHMLGDVLKLLHAAEREVCAYAVARGLRLSMAPVPLPSDCEASE